MKKLNVAVVGATGMVGRTFLKVLEEEKLPVTPQVKDFCGLLGLDPLYMGNEGKLVARVHTGDPSIYGAIGEQIRELKKHDIEYEIIPGVSSLFGTASVLEAELTLPEISQSVIITRPEGRTPKPAGESIASFSKHHATMCIFLGIGMIDKVVEELLVGYEKDTPIAVVKKATWEDQEIIKGTLDNIAEKVKDANITKTAMIVVGDVLDPGDFNPSKLYDKNFKHEYR